MYTRSDNERAYVNAMLPSEVKKGIFEIATGQRSGKYYRYFLHMGTECFYSFRYKKQTHPLSFQIGLMTEAMEIEKITFAINRELEAALTCLMSGVLMQGTYLYGYLLTLGYQMWIESGRPEIDAVALSDSKLEAE